MNNNEEKKATLTADTINICRKYVHHIRNIKSLDKEMMNNVYSMTDEEKMNIIKALNDVVDNLQSFYD